MSRKAYSKFATSLASASCIASVCTCTIATSAAVATTIPGASPKSPAASIQSAKTRAENFRDIQLNAARNLEEEASGMLRADAGEMERILAIEKTVAALRQAKKDGRVGTEMPRALQYARLEALSKLLEASEEVRAVIASVRADLATTHIALDELTLKRDMTRNKLNTANFFQSGLVGVVQQASALHYFDPVAHQTMAMASFSTGIILSTLDLAVPYLYRRDASKQSNTLACIFDSRNRPKGAMADGYLWKYFNSPIPGRSDALTRREILVKHWKTFGGVKTDRENRLKLLSNTPDNDLKETIGILNQRLNLLEDMKAHIQEFDACLFELHQAVTCE